MTASDAQWFAGVLDSRGHVRMHVKPHSDGSQGLAFDCAIIVVGDPALLAEIQRVTGAGSIRPRSAGVKQWSLYSATPIRDLIAAVSPHLRLPRRAEQLAELDRILAMTDEERQIEKQRIWCAKTRPHHH